MVLEMEEELIRMLWFIGAIVMFIIAYLLFAIRKENKHVKYILKPGTMIMIILLAITGSGLDSVFSIYVVMALLFSLAGDIFLMWDDRWFIHGLASFLGAHIIYIAGFLTSFSLDFQSSVTVTSGVILGVIALAFFMVLVLFVHKQGGTRLTVAVFSYILVITWMVWTSVITEDRLLMIAALLFYVSDAVLAYDRFKKPFSSAEYIVMATYFPAQLLFTIRVITIG